MLLLFHYNQALNLFNLKVLEMHGFHSWWGPVRRLVFAIHAGFWLNWLGLSTDNTD